MATISIRERRRAALDLMSLSRSSVINWDTLTDVVLGRSGLRKEVVVRIADLADPSAMELCAEDCMRMAERCRELECELAAVKAELGRSDAHGLSAAAPHLERIAYDLEREGLGGWGSTVNVGEYAGRIRDAIRKA